jgi:hypothetical protein
MIFFSQAYGHSYQSYQGYLGYQGYLAIYLDKSD